LSADPKDMKRLINKIRLIEKTLGENIKNIQPSEKPSIENYKRSIASNKALKKGAIVKSDDLFCIRPGTGFPPGKESEILNKTLNQKIKKGHIFKNNDFSY
jgi:sialic acid synthase SpsE